MAKTIQGDLNARAGGPVGGMSLSVDRRRLAEVTAEERSWAGSWR